MVRNAWKRFKNKEEARNKLVDLYHCKGLNLGEIAMLFSVTQGTVQIWFKKLHIKTNLGRPKRKREKIIPHPNLWQTKKIMAPSGKWTYWRG